MTVRLEDIPECNILARGSVGAYTVIVRSIHGQPCWTAFKDNVKVPCFTDAEERRFPKKVARLGHSMVKSL
jgi:hypothetical protein